MCFESECPELCLFFVEIGIDHSLVVNTMNETTKITASVEINNLDLSQQTLNNDFVQHVALTTANSTQYLHDISFGENQLNLLLVVSRFRSRGIHPFLNDVVYLD